MTNIVNLTPHTITVVNSDNQTIREYPSTGVARVATATTQAGFVDGISIYQTIFGSVEGLPDPQDGVFYIVSMVVAQAVSGRQDIIAPDTGPTAYRIDGKIIGVRQFARY